MLEQIALGLDLAERTADQRKRREHDDATIADHEHDAACGQSADTMCGRIVPPKAIDGRPRSGNLGKSEGYSGLAGDVGIVGMGFRTHRLQPVGSCARRNLCERPRSAGPCDSTCRESRRNAGVPALMGDFTGLTPPRAQDGAEREWDQDHGGPERCVWPDCGRLGPEQEQPDKQDLHASRTCGREDLGRPTPACCHPEQYPPRLS